MDLLARTGDASGAEKMAEELNKEFPDDTMLNSVWIPIARAFTWNCLTMDRKPSHSWKMLVIMNWARGRIPAITGLITSALQAISLRAIGADAAAEYEEILTTRAWKPSVLYLLAHLWIL